jgi:hypothetical protein
MFFRREKPHVPTFDERLSALAKLDVRSAKKGSGKAVLMRGECAAAVTEKDGTFAIDPAGLIVGNEIGELVDGGNQKYWMTPSGRKQAAQAEQLKALHAFLEDVREAFGLTSLYNEGLGSVNALHLYDRVKDRDRGAPRRPWEKAAV